MPPKNARDDKKAEVGGQGGADRRERKQHGRADQHLLAAEYVAHKARRKGPDDAPHNHAGHGPAQRQFVQLKVLLDEGIGSGNYRRIEAKKKTAQGSDKRDGNDIGFVLHRARFG